MNVMAGTVGYWLGEFLAPVLVVIIFSGVFLWPLLAFSAVRNLKLIRVQLERMNTTLESSGGDGSTGSTGVGRVRPDRATPATDFSLRR